MSGPQTIAQKAARALALLEDPLLKEAMDAVTAFHVEQIKDSLPDQVSLREHSYRMTLCITAIRDELQNFITSASIEQRKS